jgi:RimJ/RimL family protein N-acetyltransferase
MTIRLTLEPLDSSDMGLVRAWRNDYRIWQWCRQNDLISDAEQVRWFNRQSEDPTIKMYKLQMATPERTGPVGVAGLTSIDMLNRRAEFSLFIAPDFQGKGLGRVFLGMLFDHGFGNLGLNVIWGETFDQNPAARMFENLGMTKEGTRREFYFRDGRMVDAHLYSITAREWHDLRRRDAGNPGGTSRAESLGQAPEAAEPVAGGLQAAGAEVIPPEEQCPAKAHRAHRRGAVAKRAKDVGGA